MSGISGAFRHSFSGFTLDVAFDLPGRGVTAFFGVSGSGKTTLLRCIAGLERADSGRLVVKGEVWQDDAARIFIPVHRRPLGFVFQEASLFAHLDVRRNLDYGLGRVPAAQRRVSLAQAVDLLGIAALMDRRPDTLSGGERQRVAMAAVVAQDARVLLLDEPVAHLDLHQQIAVLRLLRDGCRRHGWLVVLTVHDLNLARRFATHALLMDGEGHATAGPAADVLTPEHCARVLRTPIVAVDDGRHLALIPDDPDDAP